MSSVNSSTIALVTGASGYVGSAIALEFLKQGFSVRLALRNEAQRDAWLETYPDTADRTSFAFITSIDTPGAFDEAVKGVTYIAHAASPVNQAPEDNKRDMVEPAINGTLEVLRSAVKSSTVEAIVLTTSIVAFVDFYKLDLTRLADPSYVVEPSSWNTTPYEVAIDNSILSGNAVYSAAKALAERAAWDFVEKEKPAFTLTTLGPSWVTGRDSSASVHSIAAIRSTPGVTLQAISGAAKIVEFPLNTHHVHIGDVARAHVKAVLVPEAAGKRFILTTGPYSHRAVAKYLVDEEPELATKLKLPVVEGNLWDQGVNADGSAAEKVLGFKYTTLKESVAGFAKQLVGLPIAI